MENRTRIVAFATKGSWTNDEVRLRALLADFDVEYLPFDKKAKRRSFFLLLRLLARRRPGLIVMEGTGLAGGLACLIARVVFGSRYVVSSGDAVGPIVAAIKPILGLPLGAYERILCRLASGFIGWTPYLCGRALTFGTPRAVTAAGWAPYPREAYRLPRLRADARKRLGIPANAVVFGIIGSLVWSRPKGYCYGLELLKAIERMDRPDVVVLVAGGGDGLGHLAMMAGDRLGRTVFLSGPVAPADLPGLLAAMDVASLPQSTDRVGSFRYTTKLSEYQAAGLPVVTGQIPLGYDLDDGWLWRLPGSAPWEDRYIDAIARLMATITTSDLATKRSAIPADPPVFERARQVRVVKSFIQDIIAELPPLKHCVAKRDSERRQAVERASKLKRSLHRTPKH